MKKGFRVLILTLLITALVGATVYASQCVVKTTESYYTLEQDVYQPTNMAKDQKYPVVFMAHNGGADKTAWGDFPQVLADEGFFTVNITWKDWDASNVEKAISYTLEKYADVIDKDKVVFIGACHGAKDFLDILNKGSEDYTVKTAVLLSLSEIDDAVKESQKEGHVPMLVYYSLNDEIGDPWGAISAEFATEVVTKPCKVVAEEDPAHGNNMLTSANKEEVSDGIVKWVKKYTK